MCWVLHYELGMGYLTEPSQQNCEVGIIIPLLLGLGEIKQRGLSLTELAFSPSLPDFKAHILSTTLACHSSTLNFSSWGIK